MYQRANFSGARQFIGEQLLLKSPIRNVDWLGLCELRNLLKLEYFEGP
jgi:hypothetical protein